MTERYFNWNNKDPLFNEAAEIVVNCQQGSTSLIQRKLSIGYNRASEIMDQLELAGIVGPYEEKRAREVLIENIFDLDTFLRRLELPSSDPSSRHAGFYELDQLMDYALTDGRISRKDKRILLHKAEKIGVDKEEFLLHLRAKKQIKRKELKRSRQGRILSFFNRVIYHRPEGYYSQMVKDVASSKLLSPQFRYEEVLKSEMNLRVWHISLPIGIVLLTVSAILLINSSIWPSDYKKFNAYLEAHDFQSAYPVAIKNRYLHDDYIRSAVSFYLGNDEVQTAINTLLEYQLAPLVGNVPGNRQDIMLNAENYNKEADFFNRMLVVIAQYLSDIGETEQAIDLLESNKKPQSIHVALTYRRFSLSYEKIDHVIKEFKSRNKL